MSPRKTPRSPLFYERETYRRRRIMDGARILPVAGFVLVLLPVLWTQSGKLGTAGQALYLFALWLALIGAAAILARPLRSALRREMTPRGRLDPGPVPEMAPETAPEPGPKPGPEPGPGAESVAASDTAPGPHPAPDTDR